MEERTSMKNRRIATGVAGLALAALIAVACVLGSASSAGAAKAKPYEILYIGDYSGPAKDTGNIHAQGLRAAASWINAHGGINGRRIVVRSVDDAGDAKTAISVTLKALSGTKPVIVDGGSEAADEAALIPVLAQQNVLSINHGDVAGYCATNAQTKCPHLFVLGGASTLQLAQPTAVSMLKKKGVTKVGIVEEAIPFAQAESGLFTQTANQAGLANTKTSVPPTAVDWTAQLQQLKSAGVNGLFVEGFGPAAGFALAARAKLGWNVPIVFDLAASAVDVSKLAPPSQWKDNAYEVVFYEQDPTVKTPGILALKAAMKKRGGFGTQPLENPATGWDVPFVLRAALKASHGKTDITSLTNAMLKIPATDPMRIFQRHTKWTATDHDNVLGAAADFSTVPVGPLVNGQVG
jgi:ABC-type branched-subunit amino acid transport system substrate-binding protein